MNAKLQRFSRQIIKTGLLAPTLAGMILVGVVLVPAASAADQPANTVFVAGLAPYERPVGFPVLRVPPANAVRSAEATHGIVGEVPKSITNFLKDQGAWYTPFSRPGAKSPYDLRSWYTKDQTVVR